MTAERRILWTVAALALVVVCFWAVSEILLPFIVGFALAYLLDPAADWLQRKGVPRWLSAAIITCAAILALVLALVLLVPLVQAQISDFIDRLPQYVEVIRDQALALVEALRRRFSDEDIAAVRERITGAVNPGTLGWIGRTLGQIWGGGVALFNLLSLLFVTPLVTYYLLRDWDVILRTVDGWLPPRHAPTIREQAGEIDRVLSGFIRGQFIVCVLLGAFYGVGLSLVGLDFGLIIGIATGLLSFMPIFGMLIGGVIGLGVALVQFGLDWHVAAVGGVFALGQFLEGNFITPRLVGSRVGLNPAWAIFALLAGGALAGFAGLLIGIPVAAVIGVVTRFGLQRWQQSAAYRGDTR